MKREIKFRALCNVDCKEGDNITKMVYFSQLELDNGLWFNPDDENIHHINEWLTKPMQYTGMKDKNGRKIYEWDIMERLYKYEVKFDKGRFYLHHKDGYHLFENSYLDFEVIGNIHEHKHLLNEN